MLLRCLSLTCVGDEVSGEIAGAECDGGGGQAQLAWRLPTRPLYSHQPLPNISQPQPHYQAHQPLLSLHPGSWTSWPRSWWGWGAARWGNAERGLVDSREVRIEINIIMSESVVTIITTAVVMVQPVIDCNQLNSCKLLNLPPGPGPHFLIIFQYLLELNRNFYTETFQ